MDPEGEKMQMLHGYNQNSAKSQMIYKFLLDYLRTKDIRHFKRVIEDSLKKQPPVIDVNYAYPNQSYETCLDIACKNGLPEFAKFLLEKGATLNRVNKAHNRGPIHFAVDYGHRDVLGVLLDEPTINPNLEAGQQTALHIAVKKNDEEAASLLLEKGASPNIPDNRGRTALHMAAIKSRRNMVNLILQKTKILDLDTYRDYNDQTAREALQENLPDIQLPPVEKRGVNGHDLKYYLNANDEKNFLKCLQIAQSDVVYNVAEDLIEIAVQKNLKDAATALLENTRGIGCNLEKAASLAVQLGSPYILRQILDTDVEVKDELLLNACLELGMPSREGSGNMDDRVECLKLILQREDVDVRCTDGKGNTPLHYAARADCREAVTLLLEKGSYIGHMNHFGVPPVADISMSTLSQYFDDCIQTRKERTNEYTLDFDYRCLMSRDAYHADRRKRFMAQENREMDVFRYIAGNKSLKHLLKHPLLSSFLYLKWHRIRYILYLNFAFYILFYLFLNSYILYSTRARVRQISNTSTNSSEHINEEGSNFRTLQVFTGITMVCLAIREILQLVSSPYHYISSLENWLEISLITLGFITLSGVSTQVDAIVILLSAWELVILIGKHPRMSTGIEIFKAVSLNFIRFLFLYAVLILAFALAFFTLFKDEDDTNFPDPGHSLFKTIIMVTGEFDANDIPFVSHPVLSHLVFMLFIFLIVIVLFNLLNGLAVSDTADILGKAELIGLISRIQILCYIENIVIPAPVVSSRHSLIFYRLMNAWSCNLLALRKFAKKILLFPTYLNGGKLSVKQYDNFETYRSRRYFKIKSNQSSTDKPLTVLDMDPRIIKQAKDILLRRGEESTSEKMFNKLENLEKKLEMIEIIRKSV